MSVRRRTNRELVAGRSMQLCAKCRSEMVQPVNWSEGPMNCWEVELRCPECEQREEGVFNQSEVDEFDRQLEEGTRSLIEDLQQLTRENMEAEADSFSVALAADLILPEDF